MESEKDKLLRKKGVPGYKFRKLMDKLFSHEEEEEKPEEKNIKETAKERWKSLGKRLGLKK